MGCDASKVNGADDQTKEVCDECAIDPKTILIMYATQSGNSKEAAENLNQKLTEAGLSTIVKDVKALQKPYCLLKNSFVYISSSGTKGGHPPASTEFMEWLSTQDADGKPLEGVKFALLGFGKKSYETFCKAPKDADDEFKRLGAEEAVAPLFVEKAEVDKDATELTAWMQGVVTVFKE